MWMVLCCMFQSDVLTLIGEVAESGQMQRVANPCAQAASQVQILASPQRAYNLVVK